MADRNDDGKDKGETRKAGHAAKRDYYEILGIAKDAKPSDIKSAYRQLAKKYHPDTNPDSGAEERFKELSEAYEVIIDPDRRKHYDVSRPGEADDHFGPKGFRWSNFTRYSDIQDIFEKRTFDTFMKHEKVASRGTDIHVNLEITLEESAFGVSRDTDVPYTESCDVCHGTGSEDMRFSVCSYCRGDGQLKNVQGYGSTQIIDLVVCLNCEGTGRIIANRCKSCRGKGTVQKHSVIRAKVPSGAEEGLKIRKIGLGEKGTGGGSDGDLYIIIRIKPHELFRKSGRDIISDLPVNFTDAALGTELKVKTLWGEVPLRIPAGTQPGEAFRLREMGLPTGTMGLKGDHIVRVVIGEVPRNLSYRQKKLLEEFARLSGGSQDGKNSTRRFLGWK